MAATYPVLSVEDFGAQLLKTGDLDPVYVALYKASLEPKILDRVCLAYWCFYHLGAACKLAEAKSDRAFWDGMNAAALNASRADGSKPWPRGAERRHFRGAQATSAMSELSGRYKTASSAVEGMIGPRGVAHTYGQVALRARSHRGFGEWIAFKIADMSERVLGYATDFSDCHLGIYKDPRQGAALVWYKRAQAGGSVIGTYAERPWTYPINNEDFKTTVDTLVKEFRARKFKAPPNGNRPVNVQEIETILCKWKAHYKGHYPLLKDSHELMHGLNGWGDLAQHVQKGAPRGA